MKSTIGIELVTIVPKKKLLKILLKNELDTYLCAQRRTLTIVVHPNAC